jgi:5-methylcytosine-specific restriction endonuclease McrA
VILIERLTPKKRLLGFDTEGNLVARECVTCSEFLSIKEFHKHAGTNLGFTTRCKKCHIENKERRQLANFNARRRRKENPEKYLLKKRIYKQKNKEHIDRVDKAWQLNNRHIIYKHSNAWKKRNKDHVYSYIRQREMRLKGCSLSLSETQVEQIKNFYKTCRKFNKTSDKKFQVDHIVPITNDLVCGLHVPWNLQILSKSENSSKKNKFDGTYDNESWRKDL